MNGQELIQKYNQRLATLSDLQKRFPETSYPPMIRGSSLTLLNPSRFGCPTPNYTVRFTNTGTPSADSMPSKTYIGGKVGSGNGIIGKTLSRVVFNMQRTGTGMTGTLILRASSADFIIGIDPQDISTTQGDHTFSILCTTDLPGSTVSSGDCIQFFANDVNFNGGTIAVSARGGGPETEFQFTRAATECAGGLGGFSCLVVLSSDD